MGIISHVAAGLLKLSGWHLDITAPDYPKCIICVAPHTSNWDFIIGKLAYAAIGRKAGFLMKQAWFFWPMGAIMRSIGGVPVRPKDKGGDLVKVLINRFNNADRLQLAITPEGTRSFTRQWRTGFLRIALGAGIPILLGGIDFRTKTVTIKRTFVPSENIEADMRAIKDYYKPFVGKYPHKFCAE